MSTLPFSAVIVCVLCALLHFSFANSLFSAMLVEHRWEAGWSLKLYWYFFKTLHTYFKQPLLPSQQIHPPSNSALPGDNCSLQGRPGQNVPLAAHPQSGRKAEEKFVFSKWRVEKIFPILSFHPENHLSSGQSVSVSHHAWTRWEWKHGYDCRQQVKAGQTSNLLQLHAKCVEFLCSLSNRAVPKGERVLLHL